MNLERVLGRGDLVLFSVSAILTIDTLASAASTGVSWFSWWAIIMIFFFLPYGLITAELGAAWPGEGGLHVWVREGLGPRWGSMASWLYWINMVYWIPPVYLVFAGVFDGMFVESGDVRIQTAIAILLTWLTVLLGLVRLKVSKWIPNLGAIVKVSIFVGLGGLGLGALATGRPPANEFSLSKMLPQWSDTVAYVPVLLYNALGFELMSSAGSEMREPQRDVPRVILLSGLAIMIVYSLGTLGLHLAVPLEKLSIVTGTWDALETLGLQWGGAGQTLVFLLGVGFLYACVANIVTWSLGANRVAATAAEEGLLPKALSKLHPRFQTPYVAFAMMGLVSTALLVGNALLSSNTVNVFWMSFKLSGVCFLLSYLLMFPSFLALRYRAASTPRPYRMPGGLSVAWAATIVCWVFVAGASLLFFAPSPTSDDPALETWILAGETGLTILAGWLLIPGGAGQR
ncbi:MAG TPA: APC family permease [Vicinamibacteria bacterium]|nr:APC family permease [Vicinamibacteria bacterium]